MDQAALLSVVVVAATAILVAIVAWVISRHRLRKLAQEATEWPTTEATVQSGTRESTQEDSRIVLPTFAFSYQISGEYYSGRFCLIPSTPFSGKAFIESLIKGLIGRKLLLRYDPQHPQVWFIPDEHIDGCKVGQKLGSHVLSLYPKD
jgi:hypothetical protein